jgi:hypothetical protein
MSLVAIVVNLVENLLFLSIIYPGFTYTTIENVSKIFIIYIWHM